MYVCKQEALHDGDKYPVVWTGEKKNLQVKNKQKKPIFQGVQTGNRTHTTQAAALAGPGVNH